jgi:hypothetical protein
MEIAAAIVGFISLTGQALQGCNYLCKIFSDARDAPEVIREVSKELCNLRFQLEAFRLLLLKIQDTCPASLTVQQYPAVPLQSCHDAVQKLQSFADEFADLSTPTGNNPAISQTRRDAIRKEWHKFEVARKGDKLRSHKLQLEAAKTSLIAAQNSILIAVELQHFDVTRDIRQSVQQLQIEENASAKAVQATRDLANDIRTAQQEDRPVTKMMSVSIDQVLSNSQRLLTQSASSDQSAHDARMALKRMEDAFSSLSTDLRNGFDNLPTAWVPMVQDAIEKSLAKHTASRQAVILSADQIPVDATARNHKTAAFNDGICSIQGRTSSERTLLQPGSASSMTCVNSCGSCLVPTNSTARPRDFMLSSRRSPKRQHTSKSFFNMGFLQVEITSSITEQEVDVDSEYVLPRRLQSRRTRFKVVPSLWFLNISLLFESGHSRPTISHPGWDNRMRVVRTHPKGSAVHEAIESADYIRFRQLLETGEISPFDLLDDEWRRSRPLFERVAFKSSLVSHPANHSKQKRLTDFAKLIADSGVDCGVGISLHCVLLALHKNLNDFTMSLFRIVMTKSQSDPFEYCYSIPDCMRFWSHNLPVVVKQDEWDVSEFRNTIEKCHGNGSWQYKFETDTNATKWEDLQERKWHLTPASLRRSKSYCLAEFGSLFVRNRWGLLFWQDEKPDFWKSKQVCEEVFGASFMESSWPTLYWKEELPPFWRSKNACVEALGSHFVRYYWPTSYWRQELPTFWHSRKTCLEFFNESFVAYEWPMLLGKTCFEFLEGKGSFWCFRYGILYDKHRNEWVAEMMNCWLKDNTTLRHSRQHCIDQYGTNFVQDELPSLLRADGLLEEDVLRLTEYGPDMDPPRPDSHRETRYGTSSKSEEFGRGDGELDNESENNSDGESGSEMSDGWETADEG